MSKSNENANYDTFHQILYLRDTRLPADFFAEALKHICISFDLHQSFIYSADHTKALKLSDYYTVSDDLELPDEISVNEHLSPAEVDQFFNSNYLLFSYGKSNSLPDIELKVMRHHIFLVAPMLDEDEQLHSFVAITSNDQSRSLTKDEVAEIVSCLKIVAHVMKVRFYKARLAFSKNTLADILDHTGVDIYVNDFHTKEILYVNKSMAIPYGGEEKMLGKICWKVLYENQTAPCSFCPQQHLIDENNEPSKVYGWDYQRPFDGSWFRVLSSAFPWVDGRLAMVVCSVDITRDKKNEHLVERMAFYDALTGIGNRHKFERDFAELLKNASALGSRGYVLFADLDDFKHINDAFGHKVGDLQLAAIGKFIGALEKCQNRAYRYGGDEFIILLEDVSKDEAIAISNEIIDRCNKPWRLDDKDYYCTISFGMAAFPEDGVTHSELLTSADSAMYIAKKSGKSRMAVYNSSSQEKFSKIKLEFALRKTVDNGFDEFSLTYNPIMDVATKEVTGVEALLRWNSPIYGNLEPKQFMDILLSRQLIVPLGRWIVETGICQLKELGYFKKKGFYISFNISKREYLNEGFTSFIFDMLKKYELPPECLMLELDARPKTLDGISEQTHIFRKSGIHISIDNFGLGNCSPDIINKIDMDMVKVDKDAIIDCLENNFSKTLVQSIAMLAHSVGLKVCAEGVENAEVEAYLQECHYDYIQGHYVSALQADNFPDIVLV